MQIEPRRARVGEVLVYYQVAGAGEPLVLVHGLSGSTRWWARNVPALAQRFHVHVIDLLGFGGSRGEHPFVLSEAAQGLIEWLDLIGIERASFVGHSMGGFISAELAADFPGRVNRLVLVDAAGLPFSRNYLKHARGLVRTLRYLPVDFFPVLATDAYRAGPVTILKALRQILTTDLREKLSQIRAPTLVVWGKNDTVIPPEIGEKLSQALPDGKLRVLEGAGHNPMWDRAQEFNRLVLRFLGEGNGPEG